MFGIAISSSSPAVAARCSYTRAGVGSVASQNVTDPTLGPLALDLMERGLTSQQAVDEIRKTADHIDYRQILAIDADGNTALHSGPRSLGIWTDAAGTNVVSAGNLLDNEHVPKEIVKAFEASTGHLGDRLLIALKAGLESGGEAGPVHSAGLQLCDKVAWPVADLRCDWTESCPIEAVSRAWDVYKPQMNAYVQRALDPSAAPSYGVPGDE